MKTLKQLWIENGEKSWLKVKSTLRQDPPDRYFIVVGKTPSGSFYGFDYPEELPFVAHPEIEYELYQEPKPRRLAYIHKQYGGVTLWFGEVVKPERFERAPWLDEPEKK